MASIISQLTRADWVALFQNMGLGLPTDETFAQMQSAIEQGLGEQSLRTTFADYFTTNPDASMENLADVITAMIELQDLEGFDLDQGLVGDTKALLQQINQSDGVVRALDKNADHEVDEKELSDGIELFKGIRESLAGSSGILKAVFDENRDGELDDAELAKGLRLFDVTGDGKVEAQELELLLYLLTQGRGLDGNGTLEDSFAAGVPIPSLPGKDLGTLNSSPGSGFRSAPASWGNNGSPPQSGSVTGNGKQPDYFTGQKGPPPASVPEANKHHIVQFRNADFNPTGPSGSKNCGPASLAMAMSALGAMPENLTNEQKVDFARALMYGSKYTPGGDVPLVDADGQTTGVDQIVAGANNAGLPATRGSGFAALDQALAEGKTIVAYGNITDNWKAQFNGVQADTSEVRYGSGSGGHFISILGKTADGKYIVSDPMFTGGAVAMTADQLAAFGNPGFAAIG